jgi:hypothetical protein
MNVNGALRGASKIHHCERPQTVRCRLATIVLRPRCMLSGGDRWKVAEDVEKAACHAALERARKRLSEGIPEPKERLELKALPRPGFPKVPDRRFRRI